MANSGYYTWEQRSILEVGPGCRTFAPERLSRMGCKKVVLITDEGVSNAGVAALVKDIFDHQGNPALVGVYDKIAMDACGDSINDCARFCRELAIDGIVAVGGGSVIDAAKAVRCMLGTRTTNVWDLIPNLMGLYVGAAAQPLGYPMIIFPTTAGTGAESTNSSVIFNEEYHTKAVLLHSNLPPEYAFLDPELTIGLPPKLTAWTGFDALCHAFEALTSPASTEMTDGFAVQAIKTILKYLPIAVMDGKNIEARTKMLVASNMACFVLTMASIAPIHNVDHAVGAKMELSHGECNTVLLPCMFEQFPAYYIPSIEKVADAFGVKREGMSAGEMAAAISTRMRELQKICHVDDKFTAKMDDALLDSLTNAVQNDPASMSFQIPEYAIRATLKAAFR